MIAREDIVPIHLSDSDMAVIKQVAEKAELGGYSNLRSPVDRMNHLSEDQLVGFSGEYALSLYWCGTSTMFLTHAFYSHVYGFSENKVRGDGGIDLPGTNVDIKTSKLKPGKLISDYHLWVRPREYKPNTIYVLGVMDVEKCVVYLVGWEVGARLVFTGERYEAVARNLRPMMPVRWWSV